MGKLKQRPLSEKPDITLFCFVDGDFNQVIYTCYSNDKNWAIELFLNQFPSIDCGKQRLKDNVIIYTCTTKGVDWHLI